MLSTQTENGGNSAMFRRVAVDDPPVARLGAWLRLGVSGDESRVQGVGSPLSAGWWRARTSSDTAAAVTVISRRALACKSLRVSALERTSPPDFCSVRRRCLYASVARV